MEVWVMKRHLSKLLIFTIILMTAPPALQRERKETVGAC